MSKQAKEEILKIANSWKKPAGLITEGEIGARNGQVIAEEIERGGLAWSGVWSHENLDAAVKRLGDKLAYNVKIVERVVEKIVERQPTAEEVATQKTKQEQEAKQKQAQKQTRKELLASMGIAKTELDAVSPAVTTEVVSGKGFRYTDSTGAKVVTEAEKAAAAAAKAATDTANALIANWGTGLNFSKQEEGRKWLADQWAAILKSTTPEKGLQALRNRIAQAWDKAENNQPTREDRMGSAVTPHHSRPNHI
jgi:hypothetical protein